MTKRGTFKPCDTPAGKLGCGLHCAGHYDSYEECRVEIVGSLGYYKCKAPAVIDGVCEYHHELGRTRELFMENLEQMFRMS